MGFFDIFKSKKKSNELYSIGMKKTRDSVIRDLSSLLDEYDSVNDEFWQDLEEIFIMADMGVDTVVRFVSELKDDYRIDKLTSMDGLYEIIIDKMFDLYLQQEVVNSNLKVVKDDLSVYLFIGVNGAGKTTSIAKLSHKLKSEGKKVLLAAADTFRAGAVDQLKVWADRVGVDIVTKEEGSDPSSVIFEAIQIAKQGSYDVLICDTAGRLQNKVNLMKELEKINKIISREVDGAPHETLLVVDATTGQNGLSQALTFTEVATISGVVLTKLDGTAKGGIVLAIRDKLKIPIKLVGLGEKMEDLQVFDIEEYIYGLFSDLVK